MVPDEFFTTFVAEGIAIKGLVVVLYVLDLTQTFVTTSFSWNLLVAGWGSPAALASIPWSGSVHVILTGLIAAIVQIFFAWRIWVLNRRAVFATITSLVIVLVALMQFSSALANAITVLSIKDLSKVPDVTKSVEVWLIGSFVADILIVLAMIRVLAQARSVSDSNEHSAFIKHLMIRSIETGAITAFVAGVDLVLFLKSENTYLHLCPSLVLGKLYTLVAVVNLNTRKSDQTRGGMNFFSGPESFTLASRKIATTPSLAAEGQEASVGS